MPHNVARLLRRPCAVPQRRSSIPTTPLRHYTSPKPPHAVSDKSEKKAEDILRIADQRYLRDTKIHAAKLIASINELQAAVSALPTSIHHRDVPESYTTAFFREKVQNVTPKLSRDAIAAIENVRAHLTDLQHEEYKDKRNEGGSVMGEFEREMATWDEATKRDTLKTWRLEEEARLIRLNESSQRLVNFVDEVLRRGSAKVVKWPLKPEFSDGGGSSEKKLGNMEEKNAPVAGKAQQSPGLADLQKQLEAKIASAREGQGR